MTDPQPHHLKPKPPRAEPLQPDRPTRGFEPDGQQTSGARTGPSSGDAAASTSAQSSADRPASSKNVQEKVQSAASPEGVIPRDPQPRDLDEAPPDREPRPHNRTPQEAERVAQQAAADPLPTPNDSAAGGGAAKKVQSARSPEGVIPRDPLNGQALDDPSLTKGKDSEQSDGASDSMHLPPS